MTCGFKNSASITKSAVFTIRMAVAFEKNIEGIYIIWLGDMPAKLTEDQMKTKLQKATSYIQVYRNEQDCMKFIVSVSNEKIFLILNQYSGVVTDKLIRELEGLLQVEFIWILLAKPNLEKKDMSGKNDLARINYLNSFDDTTVSTICKRVRQAVREGLDFNMFDNVKQRTTRDLTRNAAAFLWFQMLLNVLSEMNIDESAKQEMIDMCMSYYKIHKNEQELKNIEDYRQNYKKEDAICWYTRDCFLYKLLNKALRTEDVHSLYKFRTFIVDLCALIKELRDQRLSNHGPETLTLYRGQFITKGELAQLRANDNQLISTNGFISTTREREEAIKFLRGKPRSPDLLPLLFEITAETNSSNVTFADITHLSAFENEKEILFSLGAVFKIDSIDKSLLVQNLTIVKMKATDDGPTIVQNYTEICKRDLEDTSLNVIFGRLLIDMGQYRESKYYFGSLIESTKRTASEEDIECAPFYHNKGRAHGCMGELSDALTLMIRALEIRRRHLPLNHPDVAQTLNSIGVIEGERGHYASAMGSFKEALAIFEQQLKQNTEDRRAKLQIATTKTNIGWIHYLQGDYGRSREYQHEALTARQSLLSEDHALIADNYSALGALHHAKGEYKQAKECYEQALSMRMKTLPGDHPAIANSYQSLGGVELENGQYLDALKYYNKALHILKETLAHDHLLIAGSEKSIGSVYLEKGEHKTALAHFSKALEISVKKLSDGHPAAGECYHYIGMVYERQGSYNKAENFYKDALTRIQAALPTDHPSIAKIHSSLASVYLQSGNLVLSEKYFQRCHEIQTKNYPNHHPDLILTLNNLGVLYTHKNQHEPAERYFKQALSMCGKCFSENHLAVSRTLFNLGELYVRADKYDDAIQNYMKSLKIREAALPSNDLSLADIHARLGYVYFNKQLYPQAEQNYLKCQGTYDKNYYPADHPDLKRIKENLRLIKLAMEQLSAGTN